ncbi:DUF1697 domain-containing protein [uncultured Paraglaciecola sp.]|uniref:DUF1697 domain-containing protein n=1 Tax=uncultured Paraglaciecola sp. TaxID=1765024 RepID=UPI0030DA2351|tara:strand:+ start:5269 stop:5808 length:540 start_codon:yes stop_codon:yes gene_type:complete
MNNWIVLLRGINVGGKNIVPMKQLADMLLGLGCQNVHTYIQSGNVLLQNSESNAQVLSEKIANEMLQTFGFQPHILLLTLAQFEQAATNNPFPNAQSNPKTLHMFFLAEPARNLDFDAMKCIKKDNESFELIEDVFYLHAPDGIGRSKLAAKAEKLLAVATTARNWKTVSQLLTLANQK